MKVMVTVTIHEGDGDLKSAEFVGRFRGSSQDIAREAGQFAQRSILRAAPEEPARVVRITEEEEEVQ